MSATQGALAGAPAGALAPPPGRRIHNLPQVNNLPHKIVRE